MRTKTEKYCQHISALSLLTSNSLTLNISINKICLCQTITKAVQFQFKVVNTIALFTIQIGSAYRTG